MRAVSFSVGERRLMNHFVVCRRVIRKFPIFNYVLILEPPRLSGAIAHRNLRFRFLSGLSCRRSRLLFSF